MEIDTYLTVTTPKALARDNRKDKWTCETLKTTGYRAGTDQSWKMAGHSRTLGPAIDARIPDVVSA